MVQLSKPSLEVALIGVIIVMAFSFSIVIFMVQDDAYRSGLRENRYYKDGREGEFFTIKDDSMYAYVRIDATLEWTTIFILEDPEELDDRYSPHSNIESAILYSAILKIEQESNYTSDMIEINEYKCTSISLSVTYNESGNYVFWLWDYNKDIVMHVFKARYTGTYEINIGLSSQLISQSDGKIKPYILEGIFFPDED